jgi:molybdopterin converting factor small subunit
MMVVRVLVFARAREIAGRGEVELSFGGPPSVAELKASLVEAIPGLQPLISALHVAVNSEYAAEGDVVPEGAEVACFPPVSGG